MAYRHGTDMVQKSGELRAGMTSGERISAHLNISSKPWQCLSLMCVQARLTFMRASAFQLSTRAVQDHQQQACVVLCMPQLVGNEGECQMQLQPA